MHRFWDASQMEAQFRGFERHHGATAGPIENKAKLLFKIHSTNYQPTAKTGLNAGTLPSSGLKLCIANRLSNDQRCSRRQKPPGMGLKYMREWRVAGQWSAVLKQPSPDTAPQKRHQNTAIEMSIRSSAAFRDYATNLMLGVAEISNWVNARRQNAGKPVNVIG
jgi:hypothetical protein